MNLIRKCRFVAVVVAVLVIPACSGAPPDGLTDRELAQEHSALVGGTNEPDFTYPWVVDLNGCRGVLIDPQWVLTAAHCVRRSVFGGNVYYRRTDPYTGAEHSGQRSVSLVSGVFMHPDFQKPGQFSNDIALLRLSQPFALDPYIQTVGVPSTPKVAGAVATLASVRHDGTLPAGQLAIFRAPLPATSLGNIFEISTADTNDASLCPGDSGSGLVTYENGRAVVRGVADYASVSDCKTPFGIAGFADVYEHHGWIMQTMGKSDDTLAGNTRVRWRGRSSHGVIGLGCTNPAGTLWGPLNVLGVQEGASCPAGETQSIVCSLDSGQTQVISAFTLKTTYADGTTTTQSLPFSSKWASYYGVNPAGVIREFSCSVALPSITTTPTVGGVLAR